MQAIGERMHSLPETQPVHRACRPFDLPLRVFSGNISPAIESFYKL